MGDVFYLPGCGLDEVSDSSGSDSYGSDGCEDVDCRPSAVSPMPHNTLVMAGVRFDDAVENMAAAIDCCDWEGVRDNLGVMQAIFPDTPAAMGGLAALALQSGEYSAALDYLDIAEVQYGQCRGVDIDRLMVSLLMYGWNGPYAAEECPSYTRAWAREFMTKCIDRYEFDAEVTGILLSLAVDAFKDVKSARLLLDRAKSFGIPEADEFEFMVRHLEDGL